MVYKNGKIALFTRCNYNNIYMQMSSSLGGYMALTMGN